MVEIRHADVADADGLAAVHVQAWQVGYSGQLPDDYLRNMSVAARRQRWHTRLSDPDRQDEVLVAVSGDEIVGFASLGTCHDDDVDERTGQLYALYVHPDHWSHGIGGALIDRAVALLTRSGHVHAVVWALESNTRALRFYEHHGWQFDGTHRLDQTSDGLTLPDVRLRTTLRGLEADDIMDFSEDDCLDDSR